MILVYARYIHFNPILAWMEKFNKKVNVILVDWSDLSGYDTVRKTMIITILTMESP